MKDRVRQLVTRYHAEGLGGMNPAEVRLLLSEKQLHLAEVSARQGGNALANVVIKGALEKQIAEIAQHQKHQEMLERTSKATDRDGRDQLER